MSPFTFDYDADHPLDLREEGTEARGEVKLRHISYTSPIEGPGEARITATAVRST